MGAIGGPATAVQSKSLSFHQQIAIVSLLIAFAGFAPTYWVPMMRGTLQVPPIAHVHGAVFFSWTILFLLQASLVANRQVSSHRKIGLVGFTLAGLMIITGTLMAMHSLTQGIAPGFGDKARAFALVPLSGVIYLVIIVGNAAANTKRPEAHKRDMVLATISLLQPAVGRWFILLLAPADAVGPVPVVFTVLPGLVSDLPLLYAVLHDWRIRGRPHPVYVIGGLSLIALQVLRVPLSTSDTWLSIAGWLASLAG